MNTPAQRPFTWTDSYCEAVEAVEQAAARLERLGAIPPSDDPAARAAALRSLWERLAVGPPTPMAAQERAKLLSGRLELAKSTVPWRLEATLDAVLDELASLYRHGHRPPDVLLASDFKVCLGARTLAGAEAVIASLHELPRDHPARAVLPASEAYQRNGTPWLVLGARERRFYLAPAVADLTRWWEQQRRGAAAAAEERTAQQKAEREKAWAESPEGRLQRLADLEKTLAGLQAGPANKDNADE